MLGVARLALFGAFVLGAAIPGEQPVHGQESQDLANIAMQIVGILDQMWAW